MRDPPMDWFRADHSSIEGQAASPGAVLQLAAANAGRAMSDASFGSIIVTMVRALLIHSGLSGRMQDLKYYLIERNDE